MAELLEENNRLPESERMDGKLAFRFIKSKCIIYLMHSVKKKQESVKENCHEKRLPNYKSLC